MVSRKTRLKIRGAETRKSATLRILLDLKFSGDILGMFYIATKLLITHPSIYVRENLSISTETQVTPSGICRVVDLEIDWKRRNPDKRATQSDALDAGGFNCHREVVLNFDVLSAIGRARYRLEMTEAPLLSEEARISPMIEEKRGHSRYTGATRAAETRGEESRWKATRSPVHARQSLRYRERGTRNPRRTCDEDPARGCADPSGISRRIEPSA